MNTLDKKIDFALIITVNHANPNGDPINGNCPRSGYDSIGEISDVCLKRKIRNRLQDEGEKIFVQSNDKCDDGFKSLSERFDRFKKERKLQDEDELRRAVCEQWLDVRTFGQLFAFTKKGDDEKGVSIGIRGPLSVMPAFSVDPVVKTTTHITKSVNSMPNEKKGPDTFGQKHRVDFGVYVTFGSINCQLASRTGFTYDDALKIKKAMATLFRNDASAARPDGSMEVVKLFWWEHNCANGQYSSAKVHRSLRIEKKVEGEPTKIEDYDIYVDGLDGLRLEEIDGE